MLSRQSTALVRCYKFRSSKRLSTTDLGASQRITIALIKSGKAMSSSPSKATSNASPRKGTSNPMRPSRGNSMATRIAVRVAPEANAASLVKIETRRSRRRANPNRRTNHPRRCASRAAALGSTARATGPKKLATKSKDASPQPTLRSSDYRFEHWPATTGHSPLSAQHNQRLGG